MKKPEYRITVQPKRRGHSMEIGCQELCYGENPEELKALRDDLLQYLDDPQPARDKYLQSGGNRTDAPPRECNDGGHTSKA